MKIESAKQDIENEFEDYSEQKRETGKELKEKQKLVDDMKNNRKSYSENLRSARSSLERKLSDVTENDKSPEFWRIFLMWQTKSGKMRSRAVWEG